MIEESVSCPRCGSRYSAVASEGLCTSCLAQELLSGEVDDAPDRGVMVDGFLLGEQIGEGGMGTVWRAEQIEPVEREVALKIVKSGFDTREVLARFRREQQSLAVMDHPDIARVFDAGRTTDGRPYFAMELVEGEAITRFCRGKRLSLDERLRLFERVCAAVQHAHGKGVIHRDLKPSNILVGLGPEGHQLKVIDFGIAKAIEEGEVTGRTLQTIQGQIIGTPGYMSPEQAEGSSDIDTRSDVYSLGALLYELLSDSAPFSEETFQHARAAEVLRLLREEDPPPPSRRLTETGAGTRLPRDLDWIAMKALSRERERRYGTAAALGDEVRRFRAHEPVTAGAPGLGYRLSKFVRKHRVAVALASGLVLALVVGLLFALRAAEVERTIAVRESAAADREREAAALEREATERERTVRLEVEETLSNARRDAGLRAAKEKKHALAALWFELAGGEQNIARAALHRNAAVLPVRIIKAPRLLRETYLRFDQSGEYLIEAGQRGGAHVFDLKEGTRVGSRCAAACFVPGAPLYARGEEDGSVDIIELRTGESVESFKVPGEKLQSLVISDDGNLVLAGAGNSLSVWSRPEGRFLVEKLSHPAKTIYLHLGPRNRVVLTVDEEIKLRAFDLEDDQPAELFPPVAVRPEQWLYDHFPPVILRTDPGTIRAKMSNRGVGFYSLEGKLLRTIAEGEHVYDISVNGDLATPKFLEKDIGPSHFVPGTRNRLLSRFGEVVAPDATVLARFPFRVSSPYRISDDGVLLAARWNAGIAVFRLPQIPSFVKKKAERVPFVGRPVFSPDGRHFASGGKPHAKQIRTIVRVFGSANLSPSGPLMDTESPVYDVAFSVDGQRLFTVGKEGMQGWDWRQGKRLASFPMPSLPIGIATHPTEGWVVVSCLNGELVRVDQDLKAANVFHRWPVESHQGGFDDQMGGMAFSADGRLLYVSGIDNTCFAFDLKERKVVFTTPRYLNKELHLAPGVLAVSSHGVADLNKWFSDPLSGKLLGSGLPRGFQRPHDLALSPDGRTALVSSTQAAWVDWRAGSLLGRPFAHVTRDPGLQSEFIPGTSWGLTVENRKNNYFLGFHLWELATGAHMAPPISFPFLVYRHWLTRSPDGTSALITTGKGGVFKIDFEVLRATARPHPDLSEADRFELAQIDAFHELIDGQPVALPIHRVGSDWSERWEKFWAKHPKFRSLRAGAE